MAIRTLGDLREETEHLPDDTLIVIGYNYGDRPRTIVTPEIDRVEEQVISYSDYHRMYHLEDKYNGEYEDLRDSEKKELDALPSIGEEMPQKHHGLQRAIVLLAD